MAAKSCKSTNISGERNFAITDRHISQAPNATISHIEGKVMYNVNKTGEWLTGKTELEKHLIIKKPWNKPETSWQRTTWPKEKSIMTLNKD